MWSRLHRYESSSMNMNQNSFDRLHLVSWLWRRDIDEVSLIWPSSTWETEPKAPTETSRCLIHFSKGVALSRAVGFTLTFFCCKVYGEQIRTQNPDSDVVVLIIEPSFSLELWVLMDWRSHILRGLWKHKGATESKIVWSCIGAPDVLDCFEVKWIFHHWDVDKLIHFDSRQCNTLQTHHEICIREIVKLQSDIYIWVGHEEIKLL